MNWNATHFIRQTYINKLTESSLNTRLLSDLHGTDQAVFANER